MAAVCAAPMGAPSVSAAMAASCAFTNALYSASCTGAARELLPTHAFIHRSGESRAERGC